jgi:transcription elongation GreA/GreB family factor
LSSSRIITPLDVSNTEVGIGSVVSLSDAKKNALKYIVLGPWDADPEKHILSMQSKLVQAMLGCKKGEKFQFRDEEFVITGLKTIFDT